MKPLTRKPTHKTSSIKKFKHNVAQTKLPNVAGPMRGGIRL
jgi:hypothetical protein